MAKRFPPQQSSSVDVEFFQIARSFAVRYLAYLKQKSSQPQSLQQLQLAISKILNPFQAKESILSRLLSLQLRGDYHQVIALTLIQDLAKWSRQYYEHLSDNPQYTPLLESIIEQSIKLLNSQQQFHTIVPKQNDLLRQLLLAPHIVNHHSLEGFRTFYRKLKDVKEFYPQTVKQQQKVVFLKTVQETIEVCAKLEALKTIEFIFHNIFAELEVLEPGHEFVTSRLKLMKKIVKNLWFFHDDILYKAAFTVMKFSQQVLTLPHLFCSVLNLYEDILPILLAKPSPAPLIVFNHLIINNLKKLLQQKSPSPLILQMLLNALTEVFKEPFIEYFMKNYDANFMQESICQSALNILFEFVQNRTNEKRFEYEIFKKYLKKATDSIRSFLNTQEPSITQPSQKLLKFYEVKRKQYLEIVQDMNEKPKKLFKKLESISNREIREDIMKKYARIAKHSAHLENKKMIDLFAANNATSEELFGEYVNLLFSNLSKDVNLQEFLRFFSSNFFLNGQSQQILRVLDKITILFYNHQPITNKILKTSDSTYTFANAIILLNCDLHNPQNESKMSLQSFYKICKRINAGEDLPTQMLTTTYSSIKKNKINTFRQKSQMLGISPSNFVLICSKQEENRPDFYDLEMRMLTDENFYRYWVFDLLAGIIDQRETMKLEQLIERFVYDDNSYECEVVELVRKLAKKKPHIPLHALEKILEHANFKNSKTSQKTISYLWLAVNLIETFPTYLPTNVICQLLIFTWRMRSQIKDDMYLRQKAEIKRIRKMIKEYQKRQTKKSIMDMFSSFLSSKEEDSEPELVEEFSVAQQTSIKKMNYKVLSEKVLEVLVREKGNGGSGQSGNRVNHRVKAIEFFISYVRNDEQKIFQEFLSLLYLIFHLLYRLNLNSSDKSAQDISQSSSPTQLHPSIPPPINVTPTKSPSKKSSILTSSLHLSTQIPSKQENLSISQFQQTIEDLFYELLGLKESSITKRIENLKKKDMKKYQMLQSYSHYWVLKILISKIEVKGKGMKVEGDNQDGSIGSVGKLGQGKENRHLYLLNKSVDYIEKTDKEIFVDLVYEFEEKAKQVFTISLQNSNIRSLSNLGSSQDINAKDAQECERYKKDGVLVSKEEEKVEVKVEEKYLEQKSGQEQKIPQKGATKSQQNPSPPPQLQKPSPPSSSQQQQNQPSSQQNQQNDQQQFLIQTFIVDYRKLIQEFYVNCVRIFRKEEMKKNKEWRWLIQLEKMIKQAMENHQEKMVNCQKVVKSGSGKQEESAQLTKQKGENQELKDDPAPQLSLEQSQQHPSPQKNDILNNENTNNTNTSTTKNYHQTQAQSNPHNDFSDPSTTQINQSMNNQQDQSAITQPTDPNQLVRQKSAKQMEKEDQQLMVRIGKELMQQPEVDKNEEISIEERSFVKETLLPSQPNDNNQPFQEQNNTELQKNSQIPQNTRTEHPEVNLIQEEEQAIRKMMQTYQDNHDSSQIMSMPFYML